MTRTAIVAVAPPSPLLPDDVRWGVRLLHAVAYGRDLQKYLISGRLLTLITF